MTQAALHIKISPRLKRRIELEAQTLGIPVAEYCRGAILERLEGWRAERLRAENPKDVSRVWIVEKGAGLEHRAQLIEGTYEEAERSILAEYGFRLFPVTWTIRPATAEERQCRRNTKT